MKAKIKNIVIVVVSLAALLLVYFFFFKKSPEPAPLVSSSGNSVYDESALAESQNREIGKDFISVLLNIQNIKLNDRILSDSAFLSLKDSSIVLVSEGNGGRPNPFAPIGFELTTSEGKTQMPVENSSKPEEE